MDTCKLRWQFDGMLRNVAVEAAAAARSCGQSRVFGCAHYTNHPQFPEPRSRMVVVNGPHLLTSSDTCAVYSGWEVAGASSHRVVSSVQRLNKRTGPGCVFLVDVFQVIRMHHPTISLFSVPHVWRLGVERHVHEYIASEGVRRAAPPSLPPSFPPHVAILWYPAGFGNHPTISLRSSRTSERCP